MKCEGHLLPEGARKVAGGEARPAEREPPDHAHDIILIRAACRRYARSVLPLQGGSHGGELLCPSGSGRTSLPRHFATYPAEKPAHVPITAPPHFNQVTHRPFLCQHIPLPKNSAPFSSIHPLSNPAPSPHSLAKNKRPHSLTRFHPPGAFQIHPCARITPIPLTDSPTPTCSLHRHHSHRPQETPPSPRFYA